LIELEDESFALLILRGFVVGTVDRLWKFAEVEEEAEDGLKEFDPKLVDLWPNWEEEGLILEDGESGACEVEVVEEDEEEEEATEEVETFDWCDLLETEIGFDCWLELWVDL
jgi:hypothetical protein